MKDVKFVTVLIKEKQLKSALSALSQLGIEHRLPEEESAKPLPDLNSNMAAMGCLLMVTVAALLIFLAVCLSRY